MSEQNVEDEIDDAVRGGNIDQVRVLITRNPAMLHHDCGVGTWLHVAAKKCNLQMVQALLAMGSNVNALGKSSITGTPLDKAISADCVPVARELLEHGADPNIGDTLVSAIVGAKPNGLEMVKLLVQHGADINKEYMHHGLGQMMNPLSNAIAWGKTEIADYLKSIGARMPA